ncbi:transketolase [Candidatus Kaiserbacteria bacterium RIFCSPLOWO2_02_FULL_45_11b]|uniref:Transketolase n=1 Tax=Candidatus Kaiserbacteria bacterium RIFCSPLOWO2_12_FULL_45_26 TaxID=1798525 RepID=A0A1F6FHT5_9BACT|nr:MAG: transketolase [Candidatus Kaiserbacteria bacterium RIFCSPHIGHO2_12_45_16]OGG70341.1 MAG: transketolase [Candidatus Kaiserbacteria bacterium RIFCSPLOWO2_01_FULL_45_25]OGG83836.1 MAG: transketolase [Candidatus Kaiserbacteria bacterium RIFCSPLOWO2_02_FULL_45_11b]OGG85428.1 MAG: transketolase [Candidatus Kaiserbacteria bacterium RIFCSPLOWO2_12_FULL_45_26]
MQKVPSRNGYGEGLVEAGKRDKNIVALAADLTESTRTLPFAEAFPDRFIQVGITEQNMASVASGMAAMGKVPFIASYAMFSPGRNWEQIRTTIAYNESNVKIIGAHAGVSVGPDGATHQAIEDIALLRVVPNMVVIAPADVHEARKATLAAAKYEGPVYIRVGRSNTPVVTTAESPFEIGKAEVMYTRDESLPTPVGIVVTGTLLYNALKAAQALEAAGIGATVLHMPTIKPLDEKALLALAEGHVGIVTVEEHQRAGGLGGAVSEYLSEVAPIKIVRVGVDDQFGQSGEPDELVEHYGMGVEAIVAAAKKAV